MRHKHWVIYTSSYDRGLEHLLKMWPDVKKAVPDAELHIFYGWIYLSAFIRTTQLQWLGKIKLIS